MGNLVYQKELIAACLQNREIFQRAIRAGFTPEFFAEDEFNAYIFDVASYLNRIGNSFTQSAFEKVIKGDPELDSQDTGAFLSRVHASFRERIEDSELAFDKLSQTLTAATVFDILKETAYATQMDADPSEIIDMMRRGLNKIESGQKKFDTFDYASGFSERHETRINVRDDSAGRFKFHSHFSEFSRYFPMGLPLQTSLGVAGPTFVGKSVFLSNLAYLAVHPANGLDTVYIVAENTVEETGDRFDAIFLDRHVDILFDRKYESLEYPDDVKFFQRMLQDPSWGRLLIAKVQPRGFDANTLRAIYESAVDQGYHPAVVVVDSPDHQRSIDSYQTRYLEVGAIYYDNKAFADEYNVTMLVTVPVNREGARSKYPRNEDVAGSIDIARVLENIVMFNSDEEDKMLGRARLVVSKNRSYGIVDRANIDFRFRKSMILSPYDESFSDVTALVRDPFTRKTTPLPEIEEISVPSVRTFGPSE